MKSTTKYNIKCDWISWYLILHSQHLHYHLYLSSVSSIIDLVWYYQSDSRQLLRIFLAWNNSQDVIISTVLLFRSNSRHYKKLFFNLFSLLFSLLFLSSIKCNVIDIQESVRIRMWQCHHLYSDSCCCSSPSSSSSSHESDIRVLLHWFLWYSWFLSILISVVRLVETIILSYWCLYWYLYGHYS